MKTPEKQTAPEFRGLQFNDSVRGIGSVKPGDTFTFDTKHSDPYDRTTVVIVKTESGKRYALGSRIMIELPELDSETGKFGKTGEKVKAIKLEDIPAGVKDITIGETWDTLGSDDPVTLAMYGYNSSDPDPNFYQVEAPNPFDSAREHLTRVSEEMQV